MNGQKKLVSAKDKYAKSRLFNFVDYVNPEIVLKANELNHNSEYVKFKLECKKCKNIIDVGENKKNIRCCKEKKNKEQIIDIVINE